MIVKTCDLPVTREKTVAETSFLCGFRGKGESSSPGRTRTGSISAPLRSLLNACHWHAATSNARFDERLETLKKQWFPAFFVLVNLSSNL